MNCGLTGEAVSHLHSREPGAGWQQIRDRKGSTYLGTPGCSKVDKVGPALELDLGRPE
jgi:hypothetical protein